MAVKTSSAPRNARGAGSDGLLLKPPSRCPRLIVCLGQLRTQALQFVCLEPLPQFQSPRAGIWKPSDIPIPLGRFHARACWWNKWLQLYWPADAWTCGGGVPVPLEQTFVLFPNSTLGFFSRRGLIVRPIYDVQRVIYEAFHRVLH